MARPTFILATLLWAVLFSSVANAQTEIKIGVFLPNTTAMSGIVTSIWNALTLYAEEVNNSTLLPNATVVLSFQDTQLSKALGVSYAVSYAKDDGMFATIGETSSRITIPSALALIQFKVFQCSGSATNAELSSKADYPYFFRTLASDNVQGVVLAKYVKFMNWTQIAMITVNDEYGLGLAQSFQEEASKLSLTIVSNVLYTPRSVNFTANVLQLKDSGARIFLVFGHNDCGAEFENCGPELMITAKRHGLVGKQYVWIGAEAFYATIGMVQNRTQYGQDYRDAVNGMLAAFPLENPKTQTSNDVVAQYRQRFGSDPAPYTLFFRDCLATYVHGIKNLLQKNTTLTLAEVLNRSNSTIDALKLVNGLLFQGASGAVAYDSHADRSGKYAIINNYDSSEKVVFAYNAITDKFETLEDLRFYDGSANIPSDVATITPLVVSWNDPGVAVLVALHSVMILVVMGSIAALFKHRNSKNVKALSLNMVYLIAAGILLIYASIFASIGVPTEAHCLAQMWLPWIGFSIVISNLAVKVLRIFKIFDNPQMSQRNSLKDRTLLIISSLLVVVEVALLAIVTAIDAPKPVTSVIKSSSIQYTTCVQLRPMEINWLVNVYNFILLLFVLFLAFKTRSVVSRYRESQWIGYTVQNVCISIIVLFPIINSASSIITTFYIRTIFIFYATTVAYACLIGRTVFSIYTDGKKEQFSLSNGKLTTNHSKVSHVDAKMNSSSVLPLTGVADQTYQIEIPVKEAGSYFGTWRSHVLIFFKTKNLLAFRDKRSDVHEPCNLYDVSAVKISKSDQVEKCIEFVTCKTTFLLQFSDKTAYDSWWDLLKVNALAVGSTTTGGSSGKNKSNP